MKTIDEIRAEQASGYPGASVTPPFPAASMSTPPPYPYLIGQEYQSQIAAMNAYADPSRGAEMLSRRAVGRVGETIANVGNVAAMIPGLQGVGLAASAGGSFLNDIPVVGSAARAAHQAFFGGKEVAQEMSMMSRAQMATMGNVNMGTADMGFGGSGINPSSALQLGRRFTQMSEQSGGQFNRQDIMNLTNLAGQSGLLESAANIDQIADVTSKLMKLVGTLGEVAGQPEFRENIRKLGELRRFGLSIDQGAQTLAQVGMFSRMAGASPAEVMSGAGQMGMQAFQGAGLAPGVGVAYGAHANAAARNLSGAMDPMQAALLGGREGIQQRIAGGQAAFASGPMSYMMGAGLSFEGGELQINPGKMRGALVGGATVPGLMGQSHQNIMAVATQIAQEQGRSVPDVMVELQQRMPELQSQAVQQMGPMGMERLQMQTMSSLGQQYGLRSAAQMVAGGDPQQANMLISRATDPEYLDRQRAQVREELRRARRDARQSAADRRRQRQRRRESIEWRFSDEELEDIQEWGILRDEEGPDAEDRREAEREAMRIQRQSDAARGVRRVQFGGLDVNEQIVEEMTQAPTRDEMMQGIDPTTGAGMEKMMYTRAGGLQAAGRAGRLTGAEMEAFEGATGGGASVALGRAGLGVLDVGAGLIQDIMGSKGATRGADRFGAMYGRYRERMTEPARQVVRQVRESKKIIQQVRQASTKQTVNMIRHVRNELEEVIPGQANAATMAMRSKLEEAAANRGENGQALGSEEMLEIIRKQLLDNGVPPAQVEKTLEQNRDAWLRYAAGELSLSTDPKVKAAVEDTAFYGDLAGEFDVENIQRGVDQMKTKYRDYLEEAGITQGGPLKAGEKEAIGAFKEMDVEKQAAMIQFLGGGAEERELMMESPEQYARLHKQFQGMSDEAQTTMRKLATHVGGGATGQQLTERLKTARRGKGAFGQIYLPEAYKARLTQLGKDPEALTDPGEGGVVAGAGEKERGRVQQLESILASFDQMGAEFEKFGAASVKLSLASDKQILAAEHIITHVGEKFSAIDDDEG